MLKRQFRTTWKSFTLAACAAGGLLAAHPAQAQASGQKTVGDVFYIVMENHNFTQPSSDQNAPLQTLGNPAAPYINSLITPGNANAAQVSYASAYHNVLATPSGNNPSIHPSEPNYIWAECGVNGHSTTATPTPATSSAPPTSAPCCRARTSRGSPTRRTSI